jgi:hypothetical protein
MKYKVYHAKNPDFLVEGRNFPTDFELVATVDTNSVDEVYRLTNHISTEWWNNSEVTCIKQSRSTSCGDVVEDHLGKKFRCEMVGWKELD